MSNILKHYKSDFTIPFKLLKDDDGKPYPFKITLHTQGFVHYVASWDGTTGVNLLVNPATDDDIVNIKLDKAGMRIGTIKHETIFYVDNTAYTEDKQYKAFAGETGYELTDDISTIDNEDMSITVEYDLVANVSAETTRAKLAEEANTLLINTLSTKLDTEIATARQAEQANVISITNLTLALEAAAAASITVQQSNVPQTVSTSETDVEFSILHESTDESIISGDVDNNTISINKIRRYTLLSAINVSNTSAIDRVVTFYVRNAATNEILHSRSATIERRTASDTTPSIVLSLDITDIPTSYKFSNVANGSGVTINSTQIIISTEG